MSNKTEYFNYKGGCVVCKRTCVKEFKRRAGLGYRLMALACCHLKQL